jgi:hypothetical protein
VNLIEAIQLTETRKREKDRKRSAGGLVMLLFIMCLLFEISSFCKIPFKTLVDLPPRTNRVWEGIVYLFLSILLCFA